MVHAGVCEFCRKYLDRLPRGLVARSTGSFYCQKNNGGLHRITDVTLVHWAYIGVCPQCGVDLYRQKESWKVANFSGDVRCTEPATGIEHCTHVVDPQYNPTTTETESSAITMDKVVYNPYTAVVSNPTTGEVVLAFAEPFTATGSIHARDYVVFQLAQKEGFDPADLADVDIVVRPF